MNDQAPKHSTPSDEVPLRTNVSSDSHSQASRSPTVSSESPICIDECPVMSTVTSESLPLIDQALKSPTLSNKSLLVIDQCPETQNHTREQKSLIDSTPNSPVAFRDSQVSALFGGLKIKSVKNYVLSILIYCKSSI